eukprot:5307764-Prymnesium_polylepis.1
MAAGEAPPRGQLPPPADASEAWLKPSPLHVLLLFSGPCESESALPALLRKAGCAVTAIDTKLGGAAHDVLRPGVGPPLLQRIRAAEFDA